MSFEANLDLLDEYNQWVVSRKAALGDTTPAAFLVDRAKDEALVRVNRALDKMDELFAEYNGFDPTGDPYDAGVIGTIAELRKILEDSDE